MFTKKQQVGRIYKTVIDWEAVGGVIVIGIVVLAVLGSI